MWTQSTRPAAALQGRGPIAFDQIPAHVQRRDDLTSGAKRLYGLLRSVQRMRVEPDYHWLARELAASVRSIVRWVQQLVGAGLIAVRRRGQGLTNVFLVLADVISGIASAPSPVVPTCQPRPGYLSKKEMKRNNRGTGHKQGTNASEYIETREGLLFRDAGGRMRLIPRS